MVKKQTRAGTADLNEVLPRKKRNGEEESSCQHGSRQEAGVKKLNFRSSTSSLLLIAFLAQLEAESQCSTQESMPCCKGKHLRA